MKNKTYQKITLTSFGKSWIMSSNTMKALQKKHQQINCLPLLVIKKEILARMLNFLTRYSQHFTNWFIKENVIITYSYGLRIFSYHITLYSYLYELNELNSENFRWNFERIRNTHNSFLAPMNSTGIKWGCSSRKFRSTIGTRRYKKEVFLSQTI